MAIVNSDFLAALFTNFSVIWESAFLAATSAVEFERYCMAQNSQTDTESYNWLGTVPQMREFLGSRQYQGLFSYNYSVKNKKYEVTIEVNRSTLDDDKYNLIRPRIAQLGQRAAVYPAILAAQTLANGSTALCYDGSDFFATNHVVGNSGTQSNLITGTGTTTAQIRADLITARTAMRRWKDDQGVPQNVEADLVFIPPDLRDQFEQLINTNIVALTSGSQQSNVLLGAVDIMEDSNLTDVNDWFLMATKEILKPLVYQIRQAPEFVARDNPADGTVFDTDKYAYGVRSRFNFGYMLPELCFRVSN